ncbi:MAG TPA: hypothetical protein VL133_14150 [Devosia sp.]|nr:hypothetical protein [Devosia sp.]
MGATAPLPSELTFQLAADLESRVDGNTVLVTRAGKPVLRLALPTADVSIVRAGGPEEGGWVSPGFGRKAAADRIVWTGAVGASGVTSLIILESARAAG